MSLDLTVPSALTSLQNVQDQDENASSLYLSTKNVAIGTNAPDSTTVMTVYAPPSYTALTLQRPTPADNGGRAFAKAQTVDSDASLLTVWRLKTDDTSTYGFTLEVNGTDRLTIDQDGNLTLNVTSLTINGLPSESDGSDLVIDGNGVVGVQ